MCAYCTVSSLIATDLCIIIQYVSVEIVCVAQATLNCVLFHRYPSSDKTVKLWKISERSSMASNFNLKDDNGMMRDPSAITNLRVPIIRASELVVEASPRRVFANAHTYHINSISVNSDDETYISADDLRINLWHVGINDQSFSILSHLCETSAPLP